MSILIKGMEMPTSCYKCPLRRRNGMDIVCPAAHERFSVADINILEYRLDNCPLVLVPPHGDLIDADKLVELCDIMADKCDGIGASIWHQFKTAVEWSPIVIPEEEGE